MKETGVDPATMLMLTLFIAVVMGLGLLVSFRRAAHIRRRSLAGSEEHELRLQHLQLRLAAQKQQAGAAGLTGPERVAALREAIALWRRASQTRDAADDETFETIKRTIAAIEDELRSLGAEPEK